MQMPPPVQNVLQGSQFGGGSTYVPWMNMPPQVPPSQIDPNVMMMMILSQGGKEMMKKMLPIMMMMMGGGEAGVSSGNQIIPIVMMMVLDGDGKGDMMPFIIMMMMMKNTGDDTSNTFGGKSTDKLWPLMAISLMQSRQRHSDKGEEEQWSWCYDLGVNGPEIWNKKFKSCVGGFQSPIDIVTKDVTYTSETQDNPIEMMRYDAQTTSSFDYLKNTGRSVKLDVKPDSKAGTLSGGPLIDTYEIFQLHFHWGKDDTRGSEHTLDGKEFPLELHIVHTRKGVDDVMNTKWGLSVTGFFFEIDENDNPAIAPFVDALDKITDNQAKIKFDESNFNLEELIKPSAPVTNGALIYRYSNYDGSLTTPPCNEVVHWLNFLNPLKISATQLAKFRTLKNKDNKALVDNFRPPQPLKGRTVKFYENWSP